MSVIRQTGVKNDHGRLCDPTTRY